MNYKHSRKERIAKYMGDSHYELKQLLKDLLAQKEDRKDFYGESIGMKEQEKINRVRNTIRNNELNTLVGKLKCNGKKHFFDKGNICNCGGISFINPTPSPLDEIEEIEKMVLEVYSDNPVLYGLHKKQCEIIDKLNLIIKQLKQK